MEESVWLYFGVISVIVMLGILITIFSEYSTDSDEELFFQGIQQVGIQAETVCLAPKDTMLSIALTVPSGAVLWTESDRLCGTLGEKTQCVRASCSFSTATLIDLSSEEAQRLFRSHEYLCSVTHQNELIVVCAG